jgi:hypothetical protein
LSSRNEAVNTAGLMSAENCFIGFTLFAGAEISRLRVALDIPSGPPEAGTTNLSTPYLNHF